MLPYMYFSTYLPYNSVWLGVMYHEPVFVAIFGDKHIGAETK